MMNDEKILEHAEPWVNQHTPIGEPIFYEVNPGWIDNLKSVLAKLKEKNNGT